MIKSKNYWNHCQFVKGGIYFEKSFPVLKISPPPRSYECRWGQTFYVFSFAEFAEWVLEKQNKILD